METIPALQWVRENDLYKQAEEISYTLEKVFPTCFGITDEKILIIGDRGSKGKYVAPIMAAAYFIAAHRMHLNTKLVLQGAKKRGDKADEDVVTNLGDLDDGNMVFVNVSNKIGALGDLGKSFRKFCQKKKHRYISAMSLGDLQTKMVQKIVEAIDIDYKPMQANLQRIKDAFDQAKEIRVTTKAGTDLTYNVEGMTALMADGNYKEPGTGGNFPAGETYIPCNSNKVNGKVVIDGSTRNRKHTVVIKNPVTLTIKEGSITNIEGEDEAKELQETLEWASKKSKHPKSVRRISELGIGMNPKAEIIGSTLVDEKTINTAHIGIGSNYWFGGNIYAIIHLDQIFKHPEIEIDGKEFTF